MHIHTHHSAADPHFPSFEQRMQAMFYDEEDYLGLVLPHFSWRGSPKEFWWNYKKRDRSLQSSEIDDFLDRKVRRVVLHTQASPCSSSL